jgi:hypothetical protein
MLDRISLSLTTLLTNGLSLQPYEKGFTFSEGGQSRSKPIVNFHKDLCP